MAVIDRRALKRGLREGLEQRVESFGRAAVEAWVEEANAHLRNATPPDTASQDEWDMEPIAESVEIRKDGDRWVAEWTAESDDGVNLAEIFEFGAEPHDIEGNPVLAFPDAETGETVFRHRVRHPGIPAVAFIRIGRRRMEVQIESGEIEEIQFG